MLSQIPEFWIFTYFITNQRQSCLFILFSSKSIWLVKHFVKIPNFSEFWIWEFENSFGEHLKLNFKINDICCWSCSSSFCRLGWWGCNYNILLRFCILHPLRDSWDQTSILLFHEFTKKIILCFISQVFLGSQLFFWRFLVNY